MQRVSPFDSGHLSRIWLYALCGITLLFLVAPSLIVLPMSFSDSRFLEFPPSIYSTRWYHHYLGSGEWRAATLVSLNVAVLTTIVSTVLGTAAAYGLHATRIGVARSLFVIFLLPMVIPVILIGVGTFLLYARFGLNNTVQGLVLAHSTLAIPLVVILVTAGLKRYDLTQEQVARSLGATRLWAFLTITLPQIRFSVISAALLAFLTSFDEVVIALFIAGGEATTLPKRMFIALRDEIDPTIAAISALLTALTLAIVVLGQVLRRKDGD